jgi:type III restriction enzyme
MIEHKVNSISSRLSLRPPQRDSLAILARITSIIPLAKNIDVRQSCSIIQSEYPSVMDFERDFPSLCFALATGVGKTRLMGAFISFLYTAQKIKHFFVLAPNLTIYKKLIDDFTPNTPKYVFKGIAEFSDKAPVVITGDNYESGIGMRGSDLFDSTIHINIFNISKINSEARGGKAPRIKRLSEYIGESYFDYLAGLPDLVLLMDESHRYRASAGIQAINELRPVLGLELTATPFTESGKGPVFFKNIVYDYPLAKAMEDEFVKEPSVVTRKNFNAAQFTPEQLEKIKLEDGLRIHENTKVELETYARQTEKPVVKPFALIIARDTGHAAELQKLLSADDFFAGRYKGKVIQVHSGQSGEEKEEVIERLLSVEKNDEPTEIVIHVNMLKEGWDVTNLYTIIPLRAANARTLVEQSIGRGLRLPYGHRVGVSSVDRLNIIAHDRFQEIVDEANRSDSPLRIKTIMLEPEQDYQKIKTIVATPNFTKNIYDKKLFKPHEQRFAETVASLIKDHEDLYSSACLLTGKPWKYLLISHELVRNNMSLEYFVSTNYTN